MTIIKGQLESLKRIKSELDQRGIKRFSSVGEISSFIKNYDREKQEIIRQIKQRLDLDIDALKIERKVLNQDYNNLIIEETKKLNDRINRLHDRNKILASRSRNLFLKVFYFFSHRKLKIKIKELAENFDIIIDRKTAVAAQKLTRTDNTLARYTTDKEQIIIDQSLPKTKELAYIKEVVDNMYPLIAGAIGEKKVVNELKKLSDKNVLFNDFSIEFDVPIYNRRENDKIFSIQIDHLLITNSGIFIIETKNWSKESVENFSLRSPVKQIMRTSHAMFKILNSDSSGQKLYLDRHHWGDKKVPIRNLIAMIHHKPKEKFKFVSIKTVNEINDYISFFEPIFSDDEVHRISKYLEKMMDHNTYLGDSR